MSFASKAAQAGVLAGLAFGPLTQATAHTGPAPTTVTLYDATGGAENGGDSFASAGRILVDEFKTTNATLLTSVVLNLAKVDLKRTGTYDVVLTNVGGAGRPVLRRLAIATRSDANLTRTFQLVTIQLPVSIPLSANSSYYIGIERHPGKQSGVMLGNTVDPTVLARPSVVAGGYYYNNGGPQANAGGPYEIQVNVEAVTPPPPPPQ